MLENHNSQQNDPQRQSPAPDHLEESFSSARLPKLPKTQAPADQPEQEQQPKPEGRSAVEDTEPSARPDPARPSAELPAGSHYSDPAPSPFITRALDAVQRSVMLTGIPLLRRVPLLNRLPLVRGLLNFKEVDFPDEDRATLKRSINPATAGFIGINHPEFFTEWIIDRELAAEAAPEIACVGAHDITNATPLHRWGSRKMNIITNAPNGGAQDYAVQWALTGKGVLLHPEGMVHWTADKLQRTFPGIVDFALAATLELRKQQSARPVVIQPIAYKYRFLGDVSRPLQRELGRIERRLKLPRGRSLPLEERFYALQDNLLRRFETQFLGAAPPPGSSYFDRQERLRDLLWKQLEGACGMKLGSGERSYAELRSGLRRARHENPEALRADPDRLEALLYLCGFSRDVYNTAQLSQEQIAESVKRLRSRLLTKNWGDQLRNYLPLPAGPRSAHIRLGPPINVSPCSPQEQAQLRAQLLQLFRCRLQQTLDALNQELQPKSAPYLMANPFTTR